MMEHFLCLMVLGCVARVNAYPMALFNSDEVRQAACEAMNPSGHQSSPYTLHFSTTPSHTGQTITVTLNGTSNEPFRGFMIQARTSDGEAVGSFIPGSDTKTNCGGVSALSHASGSDKSTITAGWTTPDTDAGDVIFYYTVVQTKSTYWMKLESGRFVISSASRLSLVGVTWCLTAVTLVMVGLGL